MAQTLPLMCRFFDAWIEFLRICRTMTLLLSFLHFFLVGWNIAEVQVTHHLNTDLESTTSRKETTFIFKYQPVLSWSVGKVKVFLFFPKLLEINLMVDYAPTAHNGDSNKLKRVDNVTRCSCIKSEKPTSWSATAREDTYKHRKKIVVAQKNQIQL